MPVIIVESNKINIDKKRELVKSMTKITAKIYELPEDTVTIIIRELEEEDIGVGGKLLSEIKE